MQEVFGDNRDLTNRFRASLSEPRFARYLYEAKGNEIRAISLYEWNAKLSQSLYIYLQGWEVCLRNRLNDFLCYRYGNFWPYDQRHALRELKTNDTGQVRDARRRQEKRRGVAPAPLAAIVADLSAGFWVSQLSRRYDVPYVWRSNLWRVFPEEPRLDRFTAWRICNDLLVLRNRIAHHEPVLHLPLPQRHEELRRIVAAMCPATSAYCEAICTFEMAWNHRPTH